MSEAIKLRVETRDPAKNKGTGTRASRRLRAAGRVPAVIYGHKQAVVPITLNAIDARSMIAAASHLAELDVEGRSETVLIRDVQWDHLGREILHVDFARVNREELIETEVSLEFKGDAVGVAEGGLLQAVVRNLTVKCPAGAIPDTLKIDVSALKLGEGIHVRDLTLPQGVVVEGDPDVLLIHVVVPASLSTEPAEGADAIQPEVIKPERKDKDSD